MQCGGNRRVSYVKLGEKEGEGWDRYRRRLHTSTAHLSQVPVDLPELFQFSLYRYYIFINFANILTRLCFESYRIEMDISYGYGCGTERYGVRAVRYHTTMGMIPYLIVSDFCYFFLFLFVLLKMLLSLLLLENSARVTGRRRRRRRGGILI